MRYDGPCPYRSYSAVAAPDKMVAPPSLPRSRWTGMRLRGQVTPSALSSLRRLGAGVYQDRFGPKVMEKLRTATPPLKDQGSKAEAVDVAARSSEFGLAGQDSWLDPEVADDRGGAQIARIGVEHVRHGRAVAVPRSCAVAVAAAMGARLEAKRCATSCAAVAWCHRRHEEHDVGATMAFAWQELPREPWPGVMWNELNEKPNQRRQHRVDAR